MNPLGLLGKLAKNKDSNDKWKAIKKILIKTILKMVLGFAFSFGGIFLILVAAWYIIDGGGSGGSTTVKADDSAGYTNASNGLSIGAEYLVSWENGTTRQYIIGNGSYSDYLSKYVTEDKNQFICYTDYPDDRGDRNFAYGICHTADKGNSYFHTKEYNDVGIQIQSGGYNSVGSSRLDVSTVDQVFQALYDNERKYVTEKFQGIDIKDYEIDALTAVKYQYGNIGNAVELYKSGGNFETEFKTSNGRGGYHTPFNKNGQYKGNESRVEANKNLFISGKYQTSYGTVLTDEDISNKGESSGTKNNGNESFIDTAIRLHKHIQTNKYAYSCVHNVNNGYKNTCTCDGISKFGLSKISNKFYDLRAIDCSAFVSWCLNEYLGSNKFPTRWSSGEFDSSWRSKGWKKISMQNIEKGDILWVSGHVGIYIGDGKTVEAGCTDAIRKDYSYGNKQSVINAYTYAIRIK